MPKFAACWRMMDEQITPGRYILGDEMSVLDIYVTVISRFGPWRNRFYKTAPKLSEIAPEMAATMPRAPASRATIMPMAPSSTRHAPSATS